MKHLIILLTVVLTCSFSEAKTLVIGIIDTGFDFKSTWTNAKVNKLTVPKLCDKGHYDFTNGSNRPLDSGIHGTHIAGLIAKGNSNVDYCLIILKYRGTSIFDDNLALSNKALKRAIELGVDIINYSGGGNSRDEEECSLIKKALAKGIKIVAAAGNESNNLLRKPYYPAMCDTEVYKAINIDINKKVHKTSNYGALKNVVKVLGTNVMSIAPNNTYAILTGTSQAAAVYTGKLIKQLGDK